VFKPSLTLQALFTESTCVVDPFEMYTKVDYEW